ncbi:MAG: hypothetical protein A3G32_01105 [Deltaproteobacteria bacterium RIFCSPLOWO2_12_FULL_40_28]|nr:MAG: hypothetical protein A3C45_09990 [Deltaproteobacteria bacterium RIFCSPHIGHO2_02_FULL_40_28]OGQ19932.1 MAG: hypothetical protein A3E27_06940 [Deltaproteobacteria bacterium RIFCSPHIGHO2_12_FULL_40_32]OGQ39691.1 MAG: hypothetical protein A3I69_06370 [Deltaproteobacteria bacterium RIFCSPLOWO2_02_FULL_40_36]OGQ52947.1 MAG: hypothetical protein A3G32_01105 [Deltaproteobacteria bacterium RIFCSPLOWO2_12_FULL_40_28]
MIKSAYVDSSVLLRYSLGSLNAYTNFKKIENLYSSGLLKVEFYRAIDRMRICGELTDDEVASQRIFFLEVLDLIQIMPLHPLILEKASEHFPTVVGTLDAIHLATAIFLRQQTNSKLTFLTHDRQLGIAAMASEFDVVGIRL